MSDYGNHPILLLHSEDTWEQIQEVKEQIWRSHIASDRSGVKISGYLTLSSEFSSLPNYLKLRFAPLAEWFLTLMTSSMLNGTRAKEEYCHLLVECMNDRAIKREIRSFSYSFNSMNICYHAGMCKQYAAHSGAYLHGADIFREVITRSYSVI